MSTTVVGVLSGVVEVGEEKVGAVVGGAAQLTSIASIALVIRRRTTIQPPLFTIQRIDTDGDLIV
jgi:hypothetical protein